MDTRTGRLYATPQEALDDGVPTEYVVEVGDVGDLDGVAAARVRDELRETQRALAQATRDAGTES